MQRSGSSPSRLYCSSLFCECPKFCDLAKQRRKIFWGVSEVGKNDFSLYFCWRCVVFLVLYYSSAAIARLCFDPDPDSHYTGLQSDELMSDLVNLFTASKGGRTLWERLKTRMGSGRRSRRNDRKVMERVFTPKDAVRLILDLEMPKNRCSTCPTCIPWCVACMQGVFNRMRDAFKCAVEHI